ncbi:MAG: zinc dependent phospholipase C family protein [Candidatus Thorarchaeota archaeon]
MKKSSFILMILLVSTIPFAITLPMAQPAEAWGLTTYMFIVSEASDGISDTGWSEAFAYYLPELMSGSTTPDQAWQDWDNHLYYPETGEHHAPWAAQLWYDYAKANFTAGEWEKGFFAAGVMSHYFADPNIPIHTDDPFPGHAGYEGDINSNLGNLDLTTPTETLVTNVTAEVIAAATRSHPYYDTIVAAYPDNDTVAIESNPTIKSITEECLSRAVNGTLSLFYSLTDGITAPTIVITYDYVALFDYAHANDYSDENALTSVNQTLVRNHFEMQTQDSAFSAGDLDDVDLLILTCGLFEYTTDELSVISAWAATGNKSIIITARGDFSESEDIARPNQLLDAIGSEIRINDDNVYMQGTYNPWYNDLYDIPDPGDTMGLTSSVSSITLYSPASLYFINESPVLPIIYADKSAYQTNQLDPAITVVYDDSQDGVNGDQIPMIAVEEIGELRVLVAGTTFFSDYDYGKVALFNNVVLLENFIDWAIGNRSESNIPDFDEMGPRIGGITQTPENPDNETSVTISATITDPSSVDSAWLWFDTGTEEIEVLMSAVGDSFSAEIPIIASEPLDVFIYANDTGDNIAIRGPITVTWGADTTPTSTTTPTPTEPTTTSPPPEMMIILIGGIGIVVVLIVVVVIVKRK